MARRRSDVSAAEAAIINNVHDFFVEEKAKRTKMHGNEPATRTAVACGVLRSTVYNVRQRADNVEPVAKRGGSLPIVFDETKVLSETQNAIREQVRGFYLRN